MNERFLILPGINGTELLRTLARFGQGQFGLRVMGTVELAKLALMRSGITEKRQYLSRRDQSAIVASVMEASPYFVGGSYADAENLSSTLSDIRCYLPVDDDVELQKALSNSEFAEKNAAIAAVFWAYMNKVNSDALLDSVTLIRRAAGEAAPMDGTFYTLDTLPLSPLEAELVDKVSGGSTETTLTALFGAEQPEKFHVSAFVSAYGKMNEVEDILSQIYTHALPLDQCMVAVSDPGSYAQLFYTAAKQYGIPVTFGCGVPIVNSNPARLLNLYQHWNGAGFNCVDALRAMLLSDAFDRKALLTAINEESLLFRDFDDALQLCGSLRLGEDAALNGQRIAAYRGTLDADTRENQLLPLCEKLSRELSRGCGYFVEHYTYIRAGQEGRIDRSAQQVICDSLHSFFTFLPDGKLSDILPSLLRKSVCSENSREGALHIVDIPHAFSVLRKNLFVAGLSASVFPGAPSENYLLLDKEYQLLSASPALPTSEHRVQQKLQSLNALLELATAMGCSVSLSYCNYDTAELKEENPSASLFAIYRRCGNPDATTEEYQQQFRHCGFFSHILCDTDAHSLDYTNDLTIPAPAFAPDGAALPYGGKYDFAPTTVETFFSCPRKFFLQRVLGLQEPETDDPLTVIDPRDYGNIAHGMMELLGSSTMTEQDFLTACGDAFDRFLLQRPPVADIPAQREKGAFLWVMAQAYHSDPHNTVVLAEDALTCTHPSGVALHGRPDRLEQDKDGKYILVDYKTGKRVIHKENDPETCLQVLLYAYMLETQGITVDHCEYRYLRRDVTVPCVYNDAMKERIAEMLTAFRKALDEGNYPLSEDCKYCKFTALCHREEKGADEA